MKQDINKIAALAMLTPGEEKKEPLRRDVEVILALTAELEDIPSVPKTTDSAVSREQLRPDTAAEADTERRCIRLSRSEQEGFVRVARTVG